MGLLANVVEFGSLDPGSTSQQAHGLDGSPDFFRRVTTGVFSVSVTATVVSVTNVGKDAAAINVYVERMHSTARTIPAAGITGSPIEIGPKHGPSSISHHAEIHVGVGATAPVVAVSGVSLGWQMAVNDVLYAEHPLHARLDRTQTVAAHLAWVPVGSETGKKVTWQLNVLGVKDGTLLIGNSGTALIAIDEAVNETAGEHQETTFVIPVSVFAAAETGVHLRVLRVASSADPVTDPALHHLGIMETLIE